MSANNSPGGQPSDIHRNQRNQAKCASITARNHSAESTVMSTCSASPSIVTSPRPSTSGAGCDELLSAEELARETFSFAEEPLIFDSDDDDDEEEDDDQDIISLSHQQTDDKDVLRSMLSLGYDPFPREQVEDCGEYVRKLSHHWCPYCNEVIDDKAKW